MSVLGACWKQAKVERKVILGKKACTQKATAGRKSSMRACMEYLTTLGLGFLKYIVMAGEPEMYKYRYLGLRGRMLCYSMEKRDSLLQGSKIYYCKKR
jgi:hypothetical protein